MLAHNVYFYLKDESDAAVDALVAACKKYLSSHPGVVFFAAGKREKSLARPVNDTHFEVCLLVVFDSLASHDAYQDAPRHHQFIAECSHNWKQVIVHDADVETA